jgi:hypothetical protein
MKITLQSIVDDFDFGLCKVSHDGKNLFIHPHFYHDYLLKQLTLRNASSADNSIGRAHKWKKKYPWPIVNCDTGRVQDIDFF